MKRGKETCRILKDIRRQIAEANDIEFITSECRYQGDCLGTCPKCEAEVQYLEQQLSARHASGKAIALAGISAGLFMASCSSSSINNNSDKTETGEIEIIDSTINPDTIVTTHIDSTNTEKNSTTKKEQQTSIIIDFVGDVSWWDSVNVAKKQKNKLEQTDSNATHLSTDNLRLDTLKLEEEGEVALDTTNKR